MAPPADHPDHWAAARSQKTNSSRSHQRSQNSSGTSSSSRRYRSRHSRGSSSSEGDQDDDDPSLQFSQALQTIYILEPADELPDSAATGSNVLDNTLEIQVRAPFGITSQVRQDLALGRLFGVLTVRSASEAYAQSATAAAALPGQIVAAVLPVPALDDASDSSPPPPYVAGTLTFSMLQIWYPGTWRINVALLRVSNGSAAGSSSGSGSSSSRNGGQSVTSLGAFESEDIVVY